MRLSYNAALNYKTIATQSITSPGLLPHRGIAIVFGPPGCGKSWLLLQWGLEIASGSKFLHKLPTEQTKVLFLDLEVGENTTIDRFKKVAPLYTGANSHFAIASVPGLKLNTPKGLSWLEDCIRNFGDGVILVDNLRAAIVGDENTSEVIDSLFTNFGQLRQQYNCAFVLVHHPSKPMYYQGNNTLLVKDRGMYGARGSSDIPGKVDTMLHMERTTSIGETPAFRAVLKLEKIRTNDSVPAFGKTGLSLCFSPGHCCFYPLEPKFIKVLDDVEKGSSSSATQQELVALRDLGYLTAAGTIVKGA